MLFLRILIFISFVKRSMELVVPPTRTFRQTMQVDKNIRLKSTVHIPKNNRQLAIENDLAGVYDNWDFCSNARWNEGFTPMNSLVPNNTIFLITYPTYLLDNNTETCKSNTITRSINISIGLQTIFYSLTNAMILDVDDNAELQQCANYTNETQPYRIAEGEKFNKFFNKDEFKALLYNDIDDVPMDPNYVYNTEAYYFGACPDNNTKTYQEYFTLGGVPEGDVCDKEPFQVIDGLDAYPRAGWYGIDIHEWIDGETHTYEFGSLSECVTGRYILTAIDPTPKVEEKTCGLFGLGYFCILTWWKWLCNLFL